MGSESENATQKQIIQTEVDLIRPDGSEQDKDEDKEWGRGGGREKMLTTVTA